MAGNCELKPVVFPETAADGYFVCARCGDERLVSQEPGTFYVELETAIALGLAWLNERHTVDPKTLRVSGMRKRDQEIIAVAFRVLGAPRCGMLVARAGFAPPRREKLLCRRRNWWEIFGMDLRVK